MDLLESIYNILREGEIIWNGRPCICSSFTRRPCLAKYNMAVAPVPTTSMPPNPTPLWLRVILSPPFYLFVLTPTNCMYVHRPMYKFVWRALQARKITTSNSKQTRVFWTWKLLLPDSHMCFRSVLESHPLKPYLI